MKIVSQNRFSGKTYFYTIGSRARKETTEHDWSDPLSDVKHEYANADSEGFEDEPKDKDEPKDEPKDRLSVSQSLGRKVKIFQCDRIGPCQYQGRSV